MSVEHKLTSSIKQIIDLFQKHNFQARTLQQISAELQEKENTINQRIIRDENYFFHSEGSKPKIITINIHRPEILAHIYHNQCQSCKKTFKTALLKTYYKDGNKNSRTWGNVEPVCEECYIKLQKPQNLNQSKNTNPKKDPQQKQPAHKWEYKRVRIKTELQPTETYFVFNDNEQDEFPLTDYFWLEDKGEIDSYDLTDILNYFGQMGWEMVGFRDLSKKAPQNVFSIIENFEPYYDPRYLELECIFKRQV